MAKKTLQQIVELALANKILLRDQELFEIYTDQSSSGGSGTVTQINTGFGLSGGPITDTGEISVDDDVVEIVSRKGVADGYAPLGPDSVIPEIFVPKEIIEGPNLAAFPVTGAANKIYIALDTKIQYLWISGAYVAITTGGVKQIVEAANLAAFPVTGVVDTIYIALDTKIQYIWISGAYVAITTGGVKQIVEAANLAAFPVTGVVNNLYIALDTSIQYLWSGTAYYPITEGTSYQTVGTIINESLASLANFTQTGTAFSAGGTVSNAVGSLSFASFIRQTVYGNSDLELSTSSFSFTIPTISATSFGVGYGFRSNGSIAANSLTVGFLTDSTNRGKIAFYFNQATTGSVLSTSKITINSGDVTTVKVRWLKDRVIATWTNGTQILTETYIYTSSLAVNNPTLVSAIPNTYNYTLWALGGTYSLSNLVISNDHPKNPEYLFLVDSIGKGYNGGVSTRPVDIIQRNFLFSSTILGSANLKVEEVNINELLSFGAKNIVFELLTNNKGAGDSDALCMSKLATFVAAIAPTYTPGVNFFPCTVKPRTVIDVSSLNALIRSTYSTSFIEMYYSLWSGTSFTMSDQFVAYDGLHMNEFGYIKLVDVLMNKFSWQPKLHSNYGTKYISEQNNGYVGLGLGNTGNANYLLDLFLLGGTSFRFGTTVNKVSTGGGFLTALAASSAVFSAGLDTTDGINWFARDVSYSAVGLANGAILFYGKTLATKNAATTPPVVSRMNDNGYWSLGANLTPNSVCHVQGSFATAYVEKTANYTLTATDYTVNCTNNSFTLTLPTAIGIPGRIYVMKNTGPGTITIATTGGQLIDGSAPGSLGALGLLRVQSTGAGWIII